MKKFPDVKSKLLAEAIKRNREMRKIMVSFVKNIGFIYKTRWS